MKRPIFFLYKDINISLWAVKFLQLSNTKTKKKWAKGLNGVFTREYTNVQEVHEKNAQHFSSIGKWKLKLQWDTTTHVKWQKYWQYQCS